MEAALAVNGGDEEAGLPIALAPRTEMPGDDERLATALLKHCSLEQSSAVGLDLADQPQPSADPRESAPDGCATTFDACALASVAR